MELRLELAWDGKGDFDAWKKEVLSSLGEALRPRFSGFGETVTLNPGSLQVRRGRSWGFDVSLLTRKVGTDAVELKLEYGCRMLDASMGTGAALALLAALAAAACWIRHLWRANSSLTRADVGFIAAGPAAAGVAVFCLWIWCVSQLAKAFGKPPDRGEYERLLEEIRAFAARSGLVLPGGPVKIVRKNVKPNLGEELVFDSARPEQEWLKRVQDEYSKSFRILPLSVKASGEAVVLFIPTVWPDPFQSAFYGRFHKDAAGAVSLRGRFKLRPLMSLLLAGLAGLFLFMFCVVTWDKPGTLYQPALAAVGLYGVYRLAMLVDADNREEISSLLEAGAAPQP